MSNRERSIRTEGIILRRKDFGESDRILVLFTSKLGRVSVIAKGSRKPSSKMSGHLELFTRGSFLVSKGRNLHLLTQAETIDSYENLRKDLPGIGAGSYAVELVDAFTYEEGGNLQLYDLLVKALEALDQGQNREIATRYFELHLLDLVGFRPELLLCVECGEKVIEQNQFISGELGGVVCPNCLAKVSRGGVLPISARHLKYLRHFQRSSLEDLLALELSAEVKKGLEKSLNYYITHILEGHLNSPDFMDRIKE